MKTISILMIVAAITSGCASAPPAVVESELLNLEVPKVAKTVYIASHVMDVVKAASWAHRDYDQPLLAGKYTATKENAMGTFYAAEHYSIARKFGARLPYNLMKGGFWVPKSGEFKPRLFLLTSARPAQVDDLASLNPAKIGDAAHAPAPLTVQTSTVHGAAGANIAGGLIGAILEADYAKPPKEVMMGPITNPEMIKAISAALAQAQ